MAKKTEPVPGTSDIFPNEVSEWQFIEQIAHTVFTKYGYGEIRTPVFERTEVFSRTIGDDTDIVQKEMYTFTDRGNRSLTLRPEGTASVLRALVNDGIPEGDERRVYYIGPMFRGERPAAGRRRQFHQTGVECVGRMAPEIDAECIAMLMDYLEALEIRDTYMLINSRGTFADREKVSAALSDYFSINIDTMCIDCQRRLSTNVWRILDCKNESCQEKIKEAPSIIDNLGDSSKTYFEKVCDVLQNLKIPYQVEPRLVRGLDYYLHTVFEVTFEDIGAQNSIAGGGRYEIQLPGHKQKISGVGFAAGMERLLMVRSRLEKQAPQTSSVDIYLISLGERAVAENFTLASNLRRDGFRVLMDLEGRGMKAQLRTANKIGATLSLIRGEEELERGIIMCKNMADSQQTELTENNFTPKLSEMIGK